MRRRSNRASTPCLTERLFDQALEQARHAEARYLGKDGLAARPLDGVPVAAKEQHAILGRTLTEGSLAHKGRIATENAPVIDRVLGAGGIIHARTATPEFSLSTYTHSRMWGITRNPWNPDFTPGRPGAADGIGPSNGSVPTDAADPRQVDDLPRGDDGRPSLGLIDAFPSRTRAPYERHGQQSAWTSPERDVWGLGTRTASSSDADG
ncbi:amidase family protein [Streptomyces sp. NPDC058637]|uniref:amidase family protein n=1 Tax=Streptomyces sp. NPDC058637 TaxID=3346569 RepID=UPI00365006CD